VNSIALLKSWCPYTRRLDIMRKETLLLVFAFAVVYIVWGTTYLAVRIAIETMPPFLMAGVRYFTAGVLLYLFSLFRGITIPTWRQLGNAVFIGSLFIGLGTGCVAWALQYVDSGTTALVIAFQPLLTVILVWILLGRKPVMSSYIGILLGVVGMGLLVLQDHLMGQTTSIWGLLMLLLSMTGWGYASVAIVKLDMPKPQVHNTATQMLGGGAVLMIVSLFIEDHTQFSFMQVSFASWMAFLFLIFMGSILAFSCFNYLLQRVSPEKVSTSNYVNPIIAMLLGWAIKGEIITRQSIFAALLMLLGVLFINIDLIGVLRKKWRN